MKRRRTTFIPALDCLETRRVCDAGPIPTVGTVPGPTIAQQDVGPVVTDPTLSTDDGTDTVDMTQLGFVPTPTVAASAGCVLTLSGLPQDLQDGFGSLATCVLNDGVRIVLDGITGGLDGNTYDPATGMTFDGP